MDSYFDETIFTHGESFSMYSKINVYNNADAFLVSKQNIKVGDNCTPFDSNNDEPSKDDEFIVNLNPRGECMGINFYSLMPMNKQIKKLTPFNQISIYDGETTTPLVIDEHKSGSIYTVGQLTPFESAIMLKYYAINNSDVYITKHLYALVKDLFQDSRAWFNYNSVGIVQNYNKELIFNNEILNVPILTFSSNAVTLH